MGPSLARRDWDMSILLRVPGRIDCVPLFLSFSTFGLAVFLGIYFDARYKHQLSSLLLSYLFILRIKSLVK